MTSLIEAIRNWKKPVDEIDGIKATNAVWTLDEGFVGMPINDQTTKALGNYVDHKLAEYSTQRGIECHPNTRFYARPEHTEFEEHPANHLRDELVANQTFRDELIASEGRTPQGIQFVDVEEAFEDRHAHRLATSIAMDTKGVEPRAPDQEECGEESEEWGIWSGEEQAPERIRGFFSRPYRHTSFDGPNVNHRQTIIRLMPPEGECRTTQVSPPQRAIPCPEERLIHLPPTAHVTSYDVDYRNLTISAHILITKEGQTISQKQWFNLCMSNNEPCNLRDKVKQTVWENMTVGIGGRFSWKSISPSEAIALDTLREMVSLSEFRRYVKSGFLMVRGASGLRYQLFRDKWHTKVWNGDRVVEEICVRIKGNVPPTDNIIAFKCMIDCDEDEFRQIGNVYNMRAA